MRKRLHIVNDHKRIEEAYRQSEEYLRKHDDLHNEIAAHLSAYHEIGSLIPGDRDSAFLYLDFPYYESYSELENSFELCKQGFYRHSFFALRCVLELGVAGLYFNRDDQARAEGREWAVSGSGREWTPRFKEMVKCLFAQGNLADFDGVFLLQKKIGETYDVLGGDVHVRGFKRSSIARNQANFNRFIESSLLLYKDLMKTVVKDLVVMMLLMYPIGMQSLPPREKFNGRRPGFLDDNAQEAVFVILDEKTKEALQSISNNDPEVQKKREEIVAMPNLTEEYI